MTFVFIIIGGAAGGSLGWLFSRANRLGAEQNVEACVSGVRT